MHPRGPTGIHNVTRSADILVGPGPAQQGTQLLDPRQFQGVPLVRSDTSYYVNSSMTVRRSRAEARSTMLALTACGVLVSICIRYV